MGLVYFLFQVANVVLGGRVKVLLFSLRPGS